MSRINSLRFLMAGIVFTGLFVGCGSHGKAQIAPDFTLTDLKGNKFSLSDYKGKVVLLDFWATWCPPCQMSTPEVEKFSEAYKGRSVEVIGISLDDTSEPAAAYAASHGLRYRVALGDEAIQSKYSISGIPAFFIVSQDGYIIRSWGGYHPSMPSIWRAEVDKLLKS